MTRVSIVIPCFNMGEYVAEAVESAVRQTHPDLEVIVVDDGSSDPATQRLIGEGFGPAVRVITQPNQGVAVARNTGIAAATGDYILPLDADDTIDPRYAAVACGILDSRPDVGIVTARVALFGAQSGEWKLPGFSLAGILLSNCVVSTSMFRRADWSSTGGYDASLPFREDHDFWLKILGLGRDVVRIDELFINYRQRAGSRNETFDRAILVDTYARIFSNNAALYVANADQVIGSLLDRVDELNDFRHRYRAFESLRVEHAGAYRLLRSGKRAVRRGLAGLKTFGTARGRHLDDAP